MNEMVDRVARAIGWKVFTKTLRPNEGPEDAGMQERFDAWYDQDEPAVAEIGRAAIEAMRQPTKPMVELGWRLIRGNLRPDEIYPHMIDEALKDSP